jgi:hypothetical protein
VVEVLDEPHAARLAALVCRELDGVDAVRDGERAREVGKEDGARGQRRDEQRLAAVVVARELAAQLRDARRDLGAGEVDVAERVPVGEQSVYEASWRRNRWARRSMSRR